MKEEDKDKYYKQLKVVIHATGVCHNLTTKIILAALKVLCMIQIYGLDSLRPALDYLCSINKSIRVFFMYFEFLCFFFFILSNKLNCHQFQTKYPLELEFPNGRFLTTQWNTQYLGTHTYTCVWEPISSLPAIRIFPSPSLDSHLI